MGIRKVEDVMRKTLLAVSPSTTVAEAAVLMSENDVGAILVMHASSLLGICTERDILTKIVACGIPPDNRLVKDVMTPDPVFVSPETDFVAALVLMKNGHFRHLPVISSGKPVGMVSSRDAMASELVQEEKMRDFMQHLQERL